MSSYTLYVVDDEESIRQAVSFCLRKDYRVLPFSTAEEALAAMENSLPDLILLDVALPGLNGIQALEKIRDFHPDVLVIMITGWDDAETMEAAKGLNACDYIVKPFQLATLRRVIQKALGAPQVPHTPM